LVSVPCGDCEYFRGGFHLVPRNGRA
jgi:hypothetical protein